jgi:ribose 5-phosphate isomerase B
MRVVIAADEDTDMVEVVARLFEERGHEVARLDAGPWAVVALAAAEKVARREADHAVVLCFTGTGVAMAANKVRGVRAALCVDASTAAGARRWNDANTLALSLRLLSPAVATEIVEAWLTTVYAGSEGDSLSAIAAAEGSSG